MSLILVWFVIAAALLVTAYVVPGFRVRNAGTALMAALVVGLVNAILRPILLLLTLPINILTLGLFTFVINAALLKLAAAVVPDFEIDGWGPAILGAVVMTVSRLLISWILPG